ncbi:MAG: tRNA epoxyqueuosine(34) reductase QueG, partial [Burkholderiaceae bacterium]
HCGECTACLDVCPTQAIVAPYRLDARRCISYLTIEHDGVIPEPMRHAIGNRIYGCDDCQLVCPWNKYAQKTTVDDFAPRDVWGEPDLLAIAAWDEPTFLSQTAGSAIRRIGFTRWQRNVAIAMGNALASGGLSMAQREAFKAALTTQIGHKDAIVSQHVEWAMAQKPTQ